MIEEINLKVEHPEFDEDGRPTGKTTLTNVFSQFGFEDTGDYYHFTDDDGKRQPVMMKQPYIDVKINPDVAMWAFDMSQGYVSHLKMIALYATKRPTPRVYLLLMRELKRDQALELLVANAIATDKPEEAPAAEEAKTEETAEEAPKPKARKPRAKKAKAEEPKAEEAEAPADAEEKSE